MKVLLIVVYMYRGTTSVNEYPMQTYNECKEYARQIHANVKAGRVKTECKRLTVSNSQT